MTEVAPVFSEIGEFRYFSEGDKIWGARRAGCFIHESARIHESAVLFPFVYVGPGVDIGANCVIMSGASIGAPGFGYDEQGDYSWRYRTHPFGVVIGDDVHIGANSCIDAGRHRPTRIGRGTKIDNLVHIAHNVEIGEDCLIIALAEVSGTVEIGDRTKVSPSSAIRDHHKIGSDAHVGIGACVVSDIPAGETWAGVPARRLGS